MFPKSRCNLEKLTSEKVFTWCRSLIEPLADLKKNCLKEKVLICNFRSLSVQCKVVVCVCICICICICIFCYNCICICIYIQNVWCFQFYEKIIWNLLPSVSPPIKTSFPTFSTLLILIVLVAMISMSWLGDFDFVGCSLWLGMIDAL